MKKSLILLFTLFIISFCEAKPVAVFKEVIHNFGIIKAETPVKHTFKFSNRGNSILIIERIKAGCGCTGTILSSREIQAGGSGELEVELSADPGSGKIEKVIYVFTNDPVHRIIKIILKATVTDN